MDDRLSEATINKNFFDKLWPLILEDNICDIESKNTSEYFLPERKFDHVWAHDLLAQEAYEDYKKPDELICKIKELSTTSESFTEGALEQQPYRTPSKPIQRIDEQLAAIECDRQLRKKLAHDFANRVFPWYIQRPSYEYDFVLNENLKEQFKEPFEYEILRNINTFKCHLMIIDMGVHVQLKDLERWQKFSNYVAIIVVAHSPDTYRQLIAFNHIFRPVYMEMNVENSWHDELNYALRLGLKHATDLYLYANDGKCIVFVFSSARDICVCDTFSIVKRK